MGVEGFAQQLRRLRIAAGMTQEGLAEAAGLSVRGISDLERGVKQRPHPETVRMLAAALTLSPETLASFKAAATPRTELAPASIPEVLTPLVGRDDDARAVAALVQPGSGRRLVTLTGPGGVGKTRLSLRVAQDLRDRFADGAAFVALAGIADDRLVLPALASALGIRDLSDRAPLEVITRQLQDRQVLVVVDNVEHLLAAGPDLARLLANSRGLTILATSRAPLHLSGEQEYLVRPLDLPTPTRIPDTGAIAQSAAVRLFVQQAKAALPQFAVTDVNAGAVAAICARVDGLPLALELAAARMKTLAPAELAALLGNRLDVLTGGTRDHPTRQQTVRAAIAWSHELLPPGDQETFRRFAVFPTGATLDAATAVLAPGNAMDTLDRLTRLLDQSLVQRHDGADGQPRFTMLETIREFATECLVGSEDDAAVRDRHAAYFLALAEQGEEGLTGPDQAAWMKRLESDYGNLRAALGWAVERGDATTSQRFGSALWRFWASSGRLRESREWLDSALALNPNGASAVRAQALLRRGNIAVELADYPTAQIMYNESLAVYRALGDEMSACIALNGLGIVHWSQGNYTEARSAHETTLQLWKSRAWDTGVALALQNLGNVAMAERDYAGAREAFATSLSLRLEQGDEGGAGYARFWRGRLDRIVGQMDDANEHLTLALESFQYLNDRLGTAFALNELGSLAHDRGDHQSALTFHLDALHEREMAGDIQGTVECLEGIGAVALAQQNLELGVTLSAAAAAWRRRHIVPLIPDLLFAFEQRMNQARCDLPDATFRRAHDAGETLAIDEARELAKSLAG